MLAEALKEVLRDAGAALIGFGDMTGVAECDYPRGVAVPVHILGEILEGPTWGYYNTYNELSAKLNYIVTQGAQYLQSRGYDAVAQSTDRIHSDAERRTGMDRDAIFDMWTCRKAMAERMESRLGISSTLCGICFTVCPHTKKYISKHKEEA